MRVELVSRDRFVAAAAPLLRAAWEPPAVHYSAAHLRWQLDFPGQEEPLAALAFEGDLPVGCAAATPRRLCLGEAVDEAYLVSFVAVAASHRRQGVAAQLYAGLLDSIRALQRPVVTFAPAGSGG